MTNSTPDLAEQAVKEIVGKCGLDSLRDDYSTMLEIILRVVVEPLTLRAEKAEAALQAELAAAKKALAALAPRFSVGGTPLGDLTVENLIIRQQALVEDLVRQRDRWKIECESLRVQNVDAAAETKRLEYERDQALAALDAAGKEESK